MMIPITTGLIFTGTILDLMVSFVGLIFRVIVALVLMASAKYNKSNHPYLWAIAGFFFPIISSIVFYLMYKDKSEQTFCVINDPCYKKVM